jgi:hypothetical protein
MNGGGQVAVLLVPGARATMQDRHQIGLLIEQASMHHVGEETVVPVPLPTVVERLQEQIPAIQGRKHRLAVDLPGQRIAQRPAQPAEHRSLQQERLNRRRLTLHDFLDQIVDDDPIGPHEPVDERGHVVPPLHRQRSQLERGDPPLGTFLERRHSPRRQLQAHHVVQVRRRFVRSEPQFGRPDLDQLTTRPQPSEWQHRIGLARDHDPQVRRHPVQQERHPVLDLARIDVVVVVEHQHDLAIERADVVEQRSE